jgi:hypothetical protein
MVQTVVLVVDGAAVVFGVIVVVVGAIVDVVVVVGASVVDVVVGTAVVVGTQSSFLSIFARSMAAAAADEADCAAVCSMP